MTPPVIAIIPYQACWPDEFRAIGMRLRAALGDRALRIDHIGSTAVPGLGAKDVIDLQVTVAALEPLDALAAALATAGDYRLCRDIVEDHRPPGDASAACHWQKRYFREPEHGRPTHIHVRVAGRANQRYALLMRDFLRASPLAAGGYEMAKRALARLHATDAAAYYAVKDPICDIILAGAEAWAVATGWTPTPSDM